MHATLALTDIMYMMLLLFLALFFHEVVHPARWLLLADFDGFSTIWNRERAALTAQE